MTAKKGRTSPGLLEAARTAKALIGEFGLVEAEKVAKRLTARGGARVGAGRKPGSAQYPARIVARVTSSDEAWIAATAADEGVSPAEIVRWAIANLRRTRG
jgi:hypothetical protein